MEDCGKEDEQVTDLEYLKKLSKGNTEFMRDMIRIFLEENPAEIGTLEQAIEERDFRLINAAAHKLKSTVPFVGIDRSISGEISEIETLAKSKAGDPLMPELQAAPARAPFLPTDRELIARIEKLFLKIKCICRRACDELRPFSAG